MHKILIVSTSDIGGGAAKAAFNLYSSFNRIGVDAEMLVLHRGKSDSKITSIKTRKNSLINRLNHWIYREISQIRTSLSNTIFDFLPESFYEIPEDYIAKFDIINIHWVSHFLSKELLIAFSKKNVIWTLHDMHGFTGGCHYSAGCLKFISNCSPCPQLSNSPFFQKMVVLEFETKKKIIQFFDHKLIVASERMEIFAKESKIFKNQRIWKVPYYINQEIFFKKDKKSCRAKYYINEDKFIIGMIADNILEKRKGFIGLLSELKSKSIVLDKTKVLFFIIGDVDGKNFELEYPSIYIPRINSQDDLSDYYNTLDVIIVPSLEDNLPFTGLESMACGTPVIAFDDWGLKDFIKDGVNGFLIPKHDYKFLLTKLKSLSEIGYEEREKKSQGLFNSWTVENKVDSESISYLQIFNELEKNQYKKTFFNRLNLRIEIYFLIKIRILKFGILLLKKKITRFQLF